MAECLFLNSLSYGHVSEISLVCGRGPFVNKARQPHDTEVFNLDCLLKGDKLGIPYKN